MRSTGRAKYTSRLRPLTVMRPLPGLTQTRATASLRRPVAYARPAASIFGVGGAISGSGATVWARSLRSASVRVGFSAIGRLSYAVLPVACRHVQGGRRLAFVRMLLPAIDVQLADLLSAERALRQHALHRLFDHALGMGAAEDLPRRALLDAARIAGVAIVGLLAELVAGQRDLLGVDHHDVIAAVQVRRLHRLVLAAQAVCDQRRQPAQHHAFGVDQIPAPLDVLGRGGIGLHWIRPAVRESRRVRALPAARERPPPAGVGPERYLSRSTRAVNGLCGTCPRPGVRSGASCLRSRTTGSPVWVGSS